MLNMMKKKSVRCCCALILAALLILADRLSKLAAARCLKDAEPVTVIPRLLSLTYVENTGAAFGLFSGGAAVLFVFTAVLLVIITVLYLRLLDTDYRMPRVLLVFVFAGGCGNMIDRFFMGYVVDMIWFRPFNFPVFNLADCYITVSAFLLIILLLTKYRDEDFGQTAGRKKSDG